MQHPSAGSPQPPAEGWQGIFEDLWEKVNDEYVDPHFNGVDWKGVKKRYAPRVAEARTQEEFDELMREMLGELHDQHSAYYSPEEAQAAWRLEYGGKGQPGLGLNLLPRPEEKAAIVEWAIPGNAAAEAGIRSGDLILSVDGKPVCCDANGNLHESALLDFQGDSAVLTVKSGAAASRRVTVHLKPVHLQDVVEGKRLQGGIVYIRVNTFLKRDVAEDFGRMWKSLSGDGHTAGLVLDLRTNGGGLKYEAVGVLAYFLPDGEYGTFKARKYDAPLLIHKRSQDVNGSQHVPLAVLVDETTNSIAEVVASVLQETERARVFGNRTNGNFEVVERFRLPKGAEAYLAVERYITLHGENLEGKGVAPDVVVSQRWRDVTSPGDDEALQAAVQWLASQGK